MAKIYLPPSIPFGLVEILPLSGFPQGKVKIKMRDDNFVKIFVKSENEIQAFYPEEKDGVWIPSYKIEQNTKI